MGGRIGEYLCFSGPLHEEEIAGAGHVEEAALGPPFGSAGRRRGRASAPRKIAIIAAGIVRTNFQFASHSTCMKKSTTSIAFVHDTAIMNAHPTCGWSRHGQTDE